MEECGEQSSQTGLGEPGGCCWGCLLSQTLQMIHRKRAKMGQVGSDPPLPPRDLAAMSSAVYLYVIRKYFFDFKPAKPSNSSALLVFRDTVNTDEVSQATEFLLNQKLGHSSSPHLDGARSLAQPGRPPAARLRLWLCHTSTSCRSGFCFLSSIRPYLSSLPF